MQHLSWLLTALLCGWLLLCESRTTETGNSVEVVESLPRPAAITFGNPMRKGFYKRRHKLYVGKQHRTKDKGKARRTGKYFKHK